MKKRVLIFFCFLVFACQKSIHWNISSAGYLVKDSNGVCLPVSISGNYIADSTTNDNNFITVDVNVTGIGSYNIFSDSLNGYVFKASGNFENTGIHHVKLLCSGKPVFADTNYFSIHYDTSVCEAIVIVKSNAIPGAVFSLQGAPGKCMNDSVIGIFREGIELDSSDKVSISVNVTSAGRFNISTAIINGYSFSASGIFTVTGVQPVTIYPTGTPGKEGTDIFNVMGDSSSCSLEVKVTSDEAAFTLDGAPGKCMEDSVIGTYVKDIFLDTFSKVSINVFVTRPGKYIITTNVINGYAFSAIGLFEDTGVQTITMYAQGTPLKEGTDIFNVTAGASSCTFEVKVLSGFVKVTSDDYFPLTDSSYWIYDDLFTKGNYIKRTVDGDSSINNKVYKIIYETDSYGISNEDLFRKNNADYLEYAREDKYTGSFQYSKSIFTDLFFLSQNVQQGNYWESPEFQDVTTFNQVIVLKYGYQCLKSNAVVTVNGKVFSNVCIIEMRPQIHALANPWGPTNEIYTYYYAKGVGIIYYKAVSNFGYRKAEWQLRSWVVK